MPAVTRQFRSPRDRRQPDISRRPQYQVIPWTLEFVDGYHVDLIVEPGQPPLINLAVIPLWCNETSRYPISQIVDGLTVHLTYDGVMPPTASYSLEAFSESVRNRWGGYLAQQDWTFGPVAVSWGSTFDSVLGPDSFSIVPVGGTAPFAVYQTPYITNVTSGGDASYVAWNGAYFEIGMTSPINSGDHIELSLPTADVRDYLGGWMDVWAVDIP